MRSTHSDLARGAGRVVADNPAPYLVPPAAAIGNLMLAGVLSHIWGAYAHPTVWQVAWRAGLILTCSALIVWTTWRVGRARKQELRLASMLMAGASCLGLFVLTFRPWTADAVIVYVLVMACASVLLFLTRVLRGDGTDARPKLFGELGERVRELQDIGSTSKPKIVEGRVITDIAMVEGGDFAELAKPNVRTAIASAHDIPVSGVRMIPNRGTPRLGTMELSPVDQLADPPAWPGLSAPGGSIAEPIRLMVYQTGTQVPFYLPGDPDVGRNAVGVLLLLGQSGSGKTDFQIGLAVEARSRQDARVVYIDARKGLQLPLALRENVHLFIHDFDVAETYLGSLPAAVSSRAAQMGAHGHDQWMAGCKLCPAFELVIVDEASKFVMLEEILVELAESIRSVGICILMGIQRATGDRLPTSVRSTVGGVICMGVQDTKEGARVLSDSTIEAGANPGAWTNTLPGALYAEIPGTKEENWSLPARTYRPDRPRLMAELLAYLATVAEPVAGDATVAGSVEKAAGTGADAESDDDPELPKPEIDPDCPPDEDPRSPIERPDRPPILLDLGPEDGHVYTPAEVRQLCRTSILDARKKGVRQVKASMFAPIVDVVGDKGLKPPTLTKILTEFCQGPEPLLQRVDGRGVYEIVAQGDLVGANT